MTDLADASLGDLRHLVATMSVRLSASLVSQGTRQVWRVSVHDRTSGTLLRVATEASLLDALSLAVATS